ncbi:bacteriohemerythrin [mine drainage metagenome]|uniref:Bacteriohemerythrin n=1 Tax=mine drainage metagenome TaxID=410659 RepID=A0A1J5TD09_9ZZZZ
MRTFPWSDSLMIGHARIDADHQVLLERIGTIEETLEDGELTEALAEDYQALVAFLVRHCLYEESLMRQLPERHHARVHEHCRNHGHLIAETRAMRPLLRPGADRARGLERFQTVVVGMTRDLIMDDVELVGLLLREQRLEARPPVF